MTDVGVSVDFSLALGSLKGEVARLRRDLAGRMPVDFTVGGSGISAASGDLAFSLGGPSSGRRWYVRRVTVGTQLYPFTGTATSVLFYVGGNPLAMGTAAPLTGLVDCNTPTLPFSAFYSNEQVVVRANQQLWVVVHGPAASTAYAATGSVQDVADLPTAYSEVD
ncbi:MAG: hypothetical protein ACYCV4_18090 [Dermatophilaceae bacterium]